MRKFLSYALASLVLSCGAAASLAQSAPGGMTGGADDAPALREGRPDRGPRTADQGPRRERQGRPDRAGARPDAPDATSDANPREEIRRRVEEYRQKLIKEYQDNARADGAERRGPGPQADRADDDRGPRQRAERSPRAQRDDRAPGPKARQAARAKAFHDAPGRAIAKRMWLRHKLHQLHAQRAQQFERHAGPGRFEGRMRHDTSGPRRFQGHAPGPGFGRGAAPERFNARSQFGPGRSDDMRFESRPRDDRRNDRNDSNDRDDRRHRNNRGPGHGPDHFRNPA